MNFINVVPLFPNFIDFTVSELRRQHKELGLNKFALSLSMHPQSTPATVYVLETVKAASKVINQLQNDPIEVGVLVQSTLGHGWSGPVPLTEEPWQRIVKIDGVTSSRTCILDDGFRAYVLFVIAEIMKMHPAFLLMDDDFGLRDMECFCPLHVKAFNDATGQHLTRDELIELVRNNDVEHPLVKVFCDQRDAQIKELAVEIRKVIDSYNPDIVCTMCNPGSGHSFVNDVTHILAGKAMPSARVNNAIYGGFAPVGFYFITSKTEMVRFNFKDVPDLIDEADTFPQNYYSTNALIFHTHLINAALCGLTGAKLWMSEFREPNSNWSQRKYEAIFKKNRLMYEELQKTVNSLEWTGIKRVLTHPQAMNHPVRSSRAIVDPDWQSALLGPMGLPIAYDDGTKGGLYALNGTQVGQLSDKQLMELLSQQLLLDCDAVKALADRGFAELIGVRTVEDPMFFFTGETCANVPLPVGMMWDETMKKLECVSEEAHIQSWCVSSKGRSKDYQTVSPCMVYFTNKLGGRIVSLAWSSMIYHYKGLNTRRRQILLDACAFLNGKPLDMVLDTDQNVLSRHGLMADGTHVAALINLNVDPIDEIRLSLSAAPAAVTLLNSDGTWASVPFSWADGVLTVDHDLPLCQPVILKIK